MRSGNAPPLSGTPAAVVTASAGGRDVTSVTTTREIGGGGVPGQRAAAAADGEVTWAGATASAGPAPSPWNRDGDFPPKPGTGVTVAVGTKESGLFTALTGVIDSSAAGSDGIVTSTVIDPVDRLHRKITLPPLLASMTPATYNASLRNVGLMSDFIVDIALRRCAVFSTPYQPATVAGVCVPGQGSVWPERGQCLTAGQYANQGLAADFLSTEWGWGIYDCAATYAPDGDFTIAAGAEISCMVSGFHSAPATLSLDVAGHRFELYIAADRAVSARHYNGTSTTVVASLPAASGWRRVSMRTSAGAMSLVTDDGRTTNGPHTAGSGVTTVRVPQVQIKVQRGGRIGGVIAGALPAGHYQSYPLTARLYAGTTLNPKILASPRIQDRDALDLIQEIAEATCRSYWWDEDGTFHWMPGDVLLSRAPVATLTSRDSLVDFGWSESLSDVYSSVSVEHEVPGIARARTPVVTVWQGSGDSMESSERVEEIITPGSDVDWIHVDGAPRLVGAEFMADINLGRFSVVGGVRTDGTSTWWAYGNGGPTYLTSTISAIGAFAWKVTHETAALPAGQSVQRAMPNSEADTSLWQRWRGEKLPIIRAYGKVEWTDSSTAAGSGPAAAATYQHDGGRWVQGYLGETPARIAEFLAEWLCQPRVMAKSLTVVHDPRIQVGDVVTASDEHAHGVEVTGLVTRIKQTTEPAKQTMAIDLFVISGLPAWVTLGLHDALQPSTLVAHDDAQAGESLAEHDADPLHLL